MTAIPLSELRDWKLVDSSQDLRGRSLFDVVGLPLGTIHEMIVNTDDERVESVRTNDGREFSAEALEIRDDYAVWHGSSAGTHQTRSTCEPLIVRRIEP